MTTYTTPKPRFIGIAELGDYLAWNELDCRLPSQVLTQKLGAELGGVVPLRHLVMAGLFAGYAVVPSRGPSEYLTFCRVNP